MMLYIYIYPSDVLYFLLHISNVKIVTGATCGVGNAHSFRNTWFHSLWGVHDFTHSLYIYINIYIAEFVSFMTMFTDYNWLLCRDYSDCFVSDLFHRSSDCELHMRFHPCYLMSLIYRKLKWISHNVLTLCIQPTIFTTSIYCYNY